MNRYQFEDVISDYIENQLDLKSRKEFEQYLEANPDAQSTVDAVHRTIRSMNGMKNVSTSPDFMSRLEKRLKSESIMKIPGFAAQKRTVFGLEPLYAAISAFTFAGILFLGAQIFRGTNDQIVNPSLLGELKDQHVPAQLHNLPPEEVPVYAGTLEEDSLANESDSIKSLSPDIQNRIQYVKNPR